MLNGGSLGQSNPHESREQEQNDAVDPGPLAAVIGYHPTLAEH